MIPSDLSISHPYGGTQAIERALRLLAIFRDGQPELGMMDLVRLSQLNRTTVYRLLAVLQSAGMVAHDPLTDLYRLGPELIVLGAKALRSNPLRKICRPFLEKLAEQTGEMASLEQLESGSTLIVDEVKGRNQTKLNNSTGNIWSAHATSTGKILLAELPFAEVSTRLAGTLPQVAENTIIDWQVFQRELELTRQRGYAVAVNELESGLTELAVVVRNHLGQAVAALSIGGPTFRLTENTWAGTLQLLQQCAAQASLQLGYRAEQSPLPAFSY